MTVGKNISTLDGLLKESLKRAAWVDVPTGTSAYDRHVISAYGGGGGGSGGNYHHVWSTYKPTAPEPEDPFTLLAHVDVTRKSEPKPEPAPQVKPITHCTCGAELMGEKAVMRRLCGDCMSSGLSDPTRGPSLDARIAAAQAPAKDHDPTSEWTAGAHPNYDWVGR